MNNLQHTAIHEAGHAVVALVLGIRCSEVTIVPDYDAMTAGYAITSEPYRIWETWYDAGRHWRTVEHAVTGYILVGMAGAEAEKEILGDDYGGDGNDRDWSDTAANSSDCRWSPDEWPRIEPRLRRHARRIVRKHRAKIELLAAALLERRTMPSEEVEHLVMPKGVKSLR